MQNRIIIIPILFFSCLLNAQSDNLPPSVPVTDTYFDTKVVDEFRNLENFDDPQVKGWMKSQSEYSEAVLSKIPNRDYHTIQRLKLDKRQGYSVSYLRITGNDKYFYLKKYGNEKVGKLYYKEGINGKEEELYDPVNFTSSLKNNDKDSGHNFIINFISPSWDGNKIAISMSENGKEMSEVIVMDVNTRKVYPHVITNTAPANIAGITWLEDNSGFFYIYYPVIDPLSKQLNKNMQSVLYRIGKDPKELHPVFSRSNNPDLNISEEKYPAILAFNPDDRYYIGILVDAEDYRNTFIIKKEDLLGGKKNWKPLYDKESKVYYFRLTGDEIIFFSGYNSPNYKLCKTNIRNPDFKNPEVLVPEKKDEVFKSHVVTKDGIYYVTVKNGVEAKLYLYRDGKEIPIKLPYTYGNINLQSKGKNFSDLWVMGSGWLNQEQRFRYDLQKNTFTLENMAPAVEYPEFKDIVAEEIVVKSYDGAEVPMSLIYDKNIKRDGSAPVLMRSYGAYGDSFYPFFAISYLLWAKQGGVIAVAHIRGGGEKGTEWHTSGQKENKPNSWKDLIACAEYLVEKKFSVPKKMAIWAASAGGITDGMAVIERPDLFNAVIIESGILNALRNELGGVGQTSIQEFGSVKNANEFKGLLKMDAYQNLKKGIQYPAAFITTGINDPRVTPWQSTKFVAQLLKNTTSDKPILLKIDYEGGHGGDIPVIQRYANLSDIFAFALWQTGHPDYQPKDNTPK
ncbi:prolyl oligopeptidase family serine peptidase [Chryseobacterium arthrosphaerae]|uniref:prolyl oligopeptidase family serine peptidase n=1 Tax=Chryseobacterium arthrosphaerae TaxID=651561 RepID=UPI003D356E0A